VRCVTSGGSGGLVLGEFTLGFGQGCIGLSWWAHEGCPHGPMGATVGSVGYWAEQASVWSWVSLFCEKERGGDLGLGAREEGA
jgi:hypothetical protein